jgi:hypothetical protein
MSILTIKDMTIACNIGLKHKIMRAVFGFVINLVLIVFQLSLPVWLFWLGIVVSYLVIFQGVIGVCYFYSLLGIKKMN